MISFDKFLNIKPKVKYFPEFDTKGSHDGYDLSGIKVLTFDGADYKGQKTKVFAHLGFPEKTDSPVPAVVLIHGGGGHPEDVWIKKWNERGYAAISMDTTGYFPIKHLPHLYEGKAEGLERKLITPFYEDGFTTGPDNCGMTDFSEDIENQWMYHAVSSVILAHNILRENPLIDKDKIGICGISWGGIITATAIGYDPRFSFAIPIYGAGYIQENLSGLRTLYEGKQHEKWYPERNFHKVNVPVMWLCWNDDCNFSINSNSKSFIATRNNKNTCLSILHGMHHSHKDAYTTEESYIFADEITKGRDIPEIGAKLSYNTVKYFCSEKVKSVRLFYITEKMSYALREKYGDKNTYMEQDWEVLCLDPEKEIAEIPENAVGKYIEFTLMNGLRISTVYIED